MHTFRAGGGPGDDFGALGVERDGADGRPVAGLSAPAPGRVLTSGLKKGMTGRQEGRVFARVTLLGGDVAEATVPVLGVVPADEFAGP